MTLIFVIGLGAMGGALALRLHECGYNVTGFDVSEAARERYKAAGGQAAPSLDAVEEKDVVITSLPNDEILLSVLRNELLAKLKSHHIVIEMSTILPQTMLVIADELKGKVKQLIDSPVSGGPNEAKRGALSMLVGCEAELEKPIRDLLATLGRVELMGKVGNGKTIKLVNNMISLGNTAVLTEAFQLGVELGLDPKTMYEVLCNSGGSSTMLKKRIPYVLDEDFSARFSVNLAEKDTRLALRMAHEQNYPTPLLANVHQQYQAAASRGFGEDDAISTIKLHRR